MNRSQPQLSTLLGRRLWSLRLRLLGSGLLETLLWSGLWLAVALMAAGLAHQPLGWRRWLHLGVALIGPVLLLVDRILRPLLNLGGRAMFSRRLDDQLDAQHILVAAEESLRKPERWTDASRVSSSLIQRTREAAVKILERGDAARERIQARDILLWYILPLLLMAGFWPVNHAAIRVGYDNLSTAQGTAHPVLGLYFQAPPSEIQAGADLHLEAWDFGTPHDDVVCQTRGEFGQWRDVAVSEDVTGTNDSYRVFRAVVEALSETQYCRFRRAGILTPEKRIDVYFPPQILDLAVTVEPPAYTRIDRIVHQRVPSRLDVPQGSRLTLSGHVNHRLQKALIVTTAGDTIPMTCIDDSLTADFRLRESMAWHPRLLDQRGLVNADDLDYEVIAVADRTPDVDLTSTVQDGLLPPDGLIPLQARAVDDYGIDALILQVALGDGFTADENLQWTDIRIPGSDQELVADTDLGELSLGTASRRSMAGELAADLELAADRLQLMPGEALLLRIEAWDNRRPGPPGTGRSRILRFLLPSAVDIMSDQLAGQDSRLESLKELRRKAEDLTMDLERINREMLKDPELDFARQQEALEAMGRQQEMQKELSRLADALRDDVNQAASRGMMSMDMMEKMEKIGELMNELQSDELSRIQQQMRSAMDQLTPEQIAEAVREVAQNQEAYLEKMDRTIQLLEQMRREQQLEAAATRTEDLMREQQSLADESDQSEADAQQQSELAEQVESLREYLEELEASLAEEAAAQTDPGDQPPTPQDAMREALAEALEAMKEQDPAQSMRDAAEQMSGDSDQSAEKQHQAMRELAALYHIIREAQQTMQIMMEQTVITGLRGLAHQLLELSRQQEILTQDVPAHYDNTQLMALARRQQNILRSMVLVRDRMREILGQSSMITARLLQDLDGIVTTLENHVRQLQGQQVGPARLSARSGLTRINSVVINLLTSIETPGSGQGGGMSMPSAGQQLQRMAQTQAGLNGMTQMMMQELSGQRSSADRLEDGQLGEEQQKLADELKDLDRQSRERSERLLGDLQEIARDAEQVAREISGGDISEETLRRQERILGRMLDARNAARRRDFSTRRESRAALDLFGTTLDGEAAEQAPDDRDTFQRRQLQTESVPGEYRDLVRRYFEYLRRLEDAAGGESQ
jgi:Domain of unknown function (DUF4175)